MFALLVVVCLMTYFCKLFTLSLGNFLLRPILMGPLMGLLLGNLSQGLLFGAYLEMVYLAFFGVGGAPPPDAELAGVIASACCIYANQEISAVLLSGLLAGYCGLFLFMKGVKPFSSWMAGKEVAAIESEEVRAFEKLHRYVVFGVPSFYLPVAVILVVVLIYGLFPVLTSLPPYLDHFLQVFAYLFPAIGIANLVKNELSKEMLPFLLLGFGLAAYFGTNSMGVLVVAALVSFILNYLASTKSKEQVGTGPTQESVETDEDDFF